jgi:hypothetical protein
VESLGKGTGALLLKDDELVDAFSAIDLAGNNVDFWSPRTGLNYNVSAYQAVKQLIKDKEVMVMSVKDKGQVYDKGNVTAMYDTKLRLPAVFVFEKPVDKKKRLASLAHEFTHVFQDWNDIQSKLKFTETDAVLAESLVSAALGLKARPDHPILPLIELIKTGKHRTDKKGWTDAYDKAADLVAQDPNYAAQIKADPNADMKTGDEKKKQPEKLAAILKKLAGATSGADKR